MGKRGEKEWISSVSSHSRWSPSSEQGAEAEASYLKNAENGQKGGLGFSVLFDTTYVEDTSMIEQKVCSPKKETLEGALVVVLPKSTKTLDNTPKGEIIPENVEGEKNEKVAELAKKEKEYFEEKTHVLESE